jgi:hypothetical protein
VSRELQALVRLADEFDRRGMPREADEVDRIVRLAVERPRLADWLRRQYERLRRLFSRRRGNPAAAQEYDVAAANRLDDMLRRKQSGSPDERVFLWFCNQFPNSCPACHRRHGRMRTLRQWRGEGVPGPLVCERGDCACRLVPLLPLGTPGGIAQMDEDGDIAANIVGLRENGSGHNMNQGFALEPFFSDTKTS